MAFEFFDFRSGGEYVLKRNKSVEFVPPESVFYGPIEYEVLPGARYLIRDKFCDEIRKRWTEIFV